VSLAKTKRQLPAMSHPQIQWFTSALPVSAAIPPKGGAKSGTVPQDPILESYSQGW